VDKADARRVEKIATTLSPAEWQFHAKGQKGVVKENRHGELVTRLVDGACIFLNRPGFPTGSGCSLHQVALSRGKNPLELKPDVCWQLPLRREDEAAGDGHVTSTLRQWDRKHWGPGGAEFHWWCTESPEAFVGHRPVYEEMKAELIEMVGKEPYARLVALLDERAKRLARGVALPTRHCAPAEDAAPAQSSSGSGSSNCGGGSSPRCGRTDPLRRDTTRRGHPLALLHTQGSAGRP